MILGNRINRIVQCGHYAGYSLLMLGMILKNFSKSARIVSFDIDQTVTRFTGEWVEKAGLRDIVRTYVMDSGDPLAGDLAASSLGGAPELVFIDSSHQYSHTLEELDLWAARTAAGGFLCLHDSSRFARRFDHNGLGGVNAALEEWLKHRPTAAALMIDPGEDHRRAIYRDPYGFAIIQVGSGLGSAPQAVASHRRLIKDSAFRRRDAWVLGDGWTFSEAGVVKAPGASTGVSCLSPVVAGERYSVRAILSDVESGGLYPSAGASDLGPFFSSSGEHQADLVGGSGNAFIGLLASADFKGRVLLFDAEPIG
jgi:cephalosporin hydroxylase